VDATERAWGLQVNNEKFIGACFADDFTGGENWLEVTRTGATINNISLLNGDVKIEESLGIGTSVPYTSLHIDRPQAGVATLDFEDVSQAAIFIPAATTASYYQPLIGVGENATTFTAAISSFDDGGGAAQGLAFHTGDTNAITERLRITSGGDCQWYNTSAAVKMTWDSSASRLGIGSVSPNYTLDVEGSGMRISNTSGSAYLYIQAEASSISSLNFADAGDANIGCIKYRHADDSMAFNTNDVERLRITSAGLVGIGTDSPAQLLQVKGILGLETTNTTNYWATYAHTDDSFRLNYNGAGNDEFVITSAGLVGIGRTPTKLLDVYSTGNGEVNVERASGAAILTQAQAALGKFGTTSNHNLQLMANNTGYLTITGAGLVGIGTSVPAKKLEVSDSSSGESIPIVLSNRDVTAGTGQKVTLGFGLVRHTGTLKPEAGTIEVGREQDWTASDNSIDSYMAFSVYENNAAIERLRITSAGRVTVKKASNGEIDALTDASTVALDFDDANNFTLLTTSGVGSTRVLGNPSNLTAGQSGAIVITSDAADRLLTYSNYWDFEGGTAPSLTTTSGGVDTLVYYVASATSIHAVLLKDMK